MKNWNLTAWNLTASKGLFLGLFLMSLSPFSKAAVELPSQLSPPVQLVQSVPLETTLAEPGLPMTADVWLEMIRRSKTTIDLAQFYVSNGKTKTQKPLEPILQELEKASQRGVRIRLIVSSSMVNEDPETLERFRKMRRALVRVLDMSGISGGVHHAKYWIVDRKEVFVGSQNLDWRSLTQIHELGVKVDDAELGRQLGKIFDADWKLAKGVEDLTLGYYLSQPSEFKKVEMVASPPNLNPSDTRSALQALIELIGQAKKTMKVQLMDYVPLAGNQVYWPDLDNAIRAAVIRGVKVQLLLSKSSTTERALNYLKSLTMLPGVEIKWVTIPQYSGGPIPYARLIHSKYMVLDDEILWLGNSNWSKGYFLNSRNIELILRRVDLAQKGNQIFQRIWDSKYAEGIVDKPQSSQNIPATAPLPGAL